ncbi:hypothetical protein GLOIN_2v1870636 [Rhizophagus irregularis DAOM 181602=DAOM 197198]|nr:hypothetical protein GLOIN_2v1870636 [Rhizophagus irregularis DAOM 181602=DAOM 197198]
MKLLDEKITLIYRLCRRISEQQRLDSQTIQRLVVVDELSDEFWNISILTKITSSVFKSYEGSELPPEHWVYILAICDIVLNPSSPGIKCNDKLVLKRVDFLMVIITFIKQSPEILSMIEESSDADDGNSSSYEELFKSLDSKFS